MNINLSKTKRERERGRRRQRGAYAGLLARVCVRLNVIVNSIFQCKCVCTYARMCVCAYNCHACICMAVCCCFCVCYYNNYLKNTPISASASTAPAELFKCFCVRGLQVKTNTHTHTHIVRQILWRIHTHRGPCYTITKTHTQQLPARLQQRDGAWVNECVVCVWQGMRERRVYVPCVPESAWVPG